MPVLLFLFPVQVILGQETWAEMPSPRKQANSFEIFGETYYQMPPQLLSSNSVFNKQTKHQIRLPNEKGEEEVFELTPIPLLSKALSKKYPHLKTYKGISKSRSGVKLRLSTHPNGISAWMQINQGPDFFIQPVRGKNQIHFAYTKAKNDFSDPLFCKTEAVLSKEKKKANFSKNVKSNTRLRTFRIAVAATAEYTSFWGDNDDSNGNNPEDALAAIVSTLNRINVIFEQDLNIRLELVSDVNILYQDPTSDPFSGNFSSELQQTLDEIIGNDGYDIGHLFDFGEPNGDAGCVGCVCVPGQKGQGFSSHPFQDIFGGEYRNDYFDLDYAGHEIGHQFGAFHTFAFDPEGTGVNAEPGSGSTIMGYAGITGEDDLQQHGDAYFHYYSIKNIIDYVESISCGTTEIINAEPFVIDAGPDYRIPIGTAYELNIDSLSEDSSLTFCWEQLDSAEITASNFGPNNLVGSMARSLPPSASSKRIIPRIERVLTNNLTQDNPGLNAAWETVPLVGRRMQWGLSVRRQTLLFSQLAQDAIEVTAVSSAGPFIVNSQSESGLVLKGGALTKILWDVAETNQSPINASEVTVFLSTDGGYTFPIELAEGVPNNGSTQLIIPNNIDTTTARIKVKAKNGIFFALNPINFSIESRDLVLNFDDYAKDNCSSDSLRFSFDISRNESFNEEFSLQLEALPPLINVQFSKASYTAEDSTGFFVLRGLSSLSPNDYDFNLKAIFSAGEEVFQFKVKQREEIISPANLQFPQNESQEVSINPILKWVDNLNVDQVRVQIATDLNFNNLILDTLVSESQIQANNLLGSNLYYWRIQQQNHCAISDFSTHFSFETSSVSCVVLSALDLPKSLIDASENDDGITVSSINANFDATILDVDVLVDLTHTWIEDLTLYLEAPSGDRYLLSSGIGDSADDYVQTFFDQEASLDIESGTPPFTGSFIPIQDLSQLYGASTAGLWKLIVIDAFTQDTGRLQEFELHFCIEGTPQINSDNDSYADTNDNCPEITNEDQADIDNNGIGNVCDIFSAQNLTLTKVDVTCPDQENGSLTFNALADYLYRVEINGPNGFRDTSIFTSIGFTLNNLAPGNYDLCIYADRFPDFQYCFETQITAPQPLNVQTVFTAETGLLDIDLNGSDYYNISLNGQSFELIGENNIQLPLANKLNRVEVRTDKACQGVIEKWINLELQAVIYPNPVIEQANLILPQGVVADLYLFSGSGELFWSQKDVKEPVGVISVPMGQLSQGWYLLQIDYGSHTETLKLLKE